MTEIHLPPSMPLRAEPDAVVRRSFTDEDGLCLRCLSLQREQNGNHPHLVTYGRPDRRDLPDGCQRRSQSRL